MLLVWQPLGTCPVISSVAVTSASAKSIFYEICVFRIPALATCGSCASAGRTWKHASASWTRTARTRRRPCFRKVRLWSQSSPTSGPRVWRRRWTSALILWSLPRVSSTGFCDRSVVSHDQAHKKYTGASENLVWKLEKVFWLSVVSNKYMNRQLIIT